MKVLFLSFIEIKSLEQGSIFTDLISEFAVNNDEITVACPTQSFETSKIELEHGVKLIRIKNGQIQKTGRIKKVINMMLLDRRVIKAVKKLEKGVKFDLIINMASSLSFYKPTKYFKKRDNARVYLLMKDIFPQNAIDIGVMKKSGPWRIIYNYFRRKEKKTYKLFDTVGCMSQKNMNYLIEHNPEFSKDKFEICPNAIRPIIKDFSEEKIKEFRDKYGIPLDKKVFVYGGNLGKPQGIPFILEALKVAKDIDKAFFVIVGDGTEFNAIKMAKEEDNIDNLLLINRLPREEYNDLAYCCDVGLVFLDFRFTIPNFPSRILSYMQAGIPILTCTDASTDVGKVVSENGFGVSVLSNDPENFKNGVNKLLSLDLKTMGARGRKHLLDNYTVSKAYKIITKN